MRVTYPTQGPFCYYFNTLCIYDMIEYGSVHGNQFPRHLLCFFDRLYYMTLESHTLNTRKKLTISR